MALRPTLFTRWLTQPTRASQIFRATIQRPGPAQRPFSLQSTIQKNYKSPFQRTANSNSRTRTNQQQQRFNSNSTNSNARANQSNTHQPPKEPTGLSARLKKLTREYGWAALGVYLTLSALDFPFCFAAVRLLGVERIGHFEHVILGYLKGLAGPLWPGSKGGSGDGDESETETSETNGSSAKVDGEVVGADGAVIAEKNGEASIWTQLVFAYAIHKSLLIFVRVPLTAAVTPKVVKVLRRWGWDIGKRKPKSPGSGSGSGSGSSASS